MSAGAGRYAPSPSGDLHLGNLRTALVAWLFARTTDRRFLLRIEDVDVERSRSADGQLADLHAIGVDWDGEPIVQSSLASRHIEVLAGLIDRGLTYECFCTRREIQDAPRAPHAPPGSYPGTCRSLTEAERAERAAVRPPSIRFRSDVTTARFTDELHGVVDGVVDDFVLRRWDGAFAYNFVVVVDDADEGIDQVVRGDDLLDSTARQVALQDVLGLPRPSYAHVGLVLNPQGRRLAKRDGAVTLADLGMGGAEVRSLLAASLGLAEPGEQVSMAELARRFDPAALPRDPWLLDPAQLDPATLT